MQCDVAPGEIAEHRKEAKKIVESYLTFRPRKIDWSRWCKMINRRCDAFDPVVMLVIEKTFTKRCRTEAHAVGSDRPDVKCRSRRSFTREGSRIGFIIWVLLSSIMKPILHSFWPGLRCSLSVFLGRGCWLHEGIANLDRRWPCEMIERNQGA